MVHRLDGARLKIIRAQEHLDSLKAEIGMYLNTKPYEVVRKEKVETGQYLTELRVTIPPPLRLSTVVGDCVGNARASLDYIMWELAGRYLSPPLDPKKELWLVSFPIWRDPNHQRYLDHMKCLANRQVPAEAVDEIKTAQPHNRGYVPLWWLHELVNADKHRAPLLTIGHLGDTAITFAVPSSFNLDYGGSVIISGEVTDVTAYLGATGASLRSSQMDVNAQLAICVAWKDVSMPRIPIERTLADIVKTVADVIPRFDRFF